jgi:type VI secretion system protein ImpM
MGLPMPSELGFFGKLPGVGDFVQRGLPANFVARWDAHFQRVLAAVQTQLGPHWAPAYDDGPVWRFMLGPGVCGERAWAGVMGPARDRVGRRFPMVLATAVDGTAGSASLLLRTQAWFAALERLHRQAQDADAAGAEAFAAWIAAMPAGPALADTADPSLATVDWRGMDYGVLPACPPDGNWLAQLWERLPEHHGADALWWSVGDARTAGGIRLTHGLPTTTAYRGMLKPEADMPVASAVSVDDYPQPLAPRPPVPLPTDPAPLAWPPAIEAMDESAPRLPPDSGVRMSVLQRGPVTRSVICVDSASDGQLRHGATMACEAIEQAVELDLAALGASLLALHPRLRLAREDLIDPVEEDVAVLVLQTEADHAGLLRIGEASAWLCRVGALQPLFEETGTTAAMASSRPGLGALGMPRTEQVRCRLQAGDRLLLLAGRRLTALPPSQLAEALAMPSVQASCRQLALRAGLPDTTAPLRLIEIAA